MVGWDFLVLAAVATAAPSTCDKGNGTQQKWQSRAGRGGTGHVRAWGSGGAGYAAHTGHDPGLSGGLAAHHHCRWPSNAVGRNPLHLAMRVDENIPP